MEARQARQFGKPLPVPSRAAISQQLKFLAEVKLVSYEVEGAQHLYRLNPPAFVPLQEYVEGLNSLRAHRTDA